MTTRRRTCSERVLCRSNRRELPVNGNTSWFTWASHGQKGRSEDRNGRRSHHTELGTRSRLFLRTHSHVKIFCLGMGWCPKDPPKMAKTAFRLGRRSRSITRGNEKVQRPSMCLPFCSTSSAPTAVASTCLRPLTPLYSGESLTATGEPSLVVDDISTTE